MQSGSRRKITTRASWCAFTLAAILCLPGVHARTGDKPVISSISVCSDIAGGDQGSCDTGYDTHQIVLGPDGSSINAYLNGFISDEHSSVFPPGSLNGNHDYLFFVAAGTPANKNVGALVLSGGSGPDANGQWTFDYPFADDYGDYPCIDGSGDPCGFGHIFSEPVTETHCPQPRSGDPMDAVNQDQTFDLEYAAPGSVVPNPAGPPGALLMVYESVNHCVGLGRQLANNTKAYITTGIATSLDYGRTWPTYRGTDTFDFYRLPAENPWQGPNAPGGALGSAVCMGNNCAVQPPLDYGRYEILSPPVSLASLMTAGHIIPDDFGEGEVSAFLDDAGPRHDRYLYVLTGAMNIARAKIDDPGPLAFLRWDGTYFESPGIGGLDSPIIGPGRFDQCGLPDQNAFGASISYVEETQQYLLTFVCVSPGDPAHHVLDASKYGAAWFYATTDDLSSQLNWSVPQEIAGSWSQFTSTMDGGTIPAACEIYKGWYPTFMSPRRKPGRLNTTGYVFYSWGCQQGDTPAPGREFSSRRFTITTTGGQSPQ